ncbi:MAG: hypothetical protein HWE27_06770 [Gammaproteobacteria bacterium]|nr:hypothetical protein [Gammaproteobacteria bacterium]
MHKWQKYLKFGLVFVTSALFLHGCATPAIPMKPNDDLPEGFGALMLISHCPFREGVRYFEIYRKGDSRSAGKTFKTKAFSPGTEFRVLQLPAGEYSIQEFKIGPYMLRIPKDGLDFTVYPGRVNYFGDLYFRDSGTGSLQYIISDRTEQANSLLTNRYPELINKYPLEYVATE